MSLPVLQYEVMVVGGGQAGLAMGYHLRQRGVDFTILDAESETGATWRNRWDSLTLFTPAGFSSLPGLPMHADPQHVPAKDEVADYLVRYARHFDLPIRHEERVARLERKTDGRFRMVTATSTYESEQVVIATGPYQNPNIPRFAAALAPDVGQWHSSEYRSPSQLPRDGNVLVVGGGNSGVQIAAELAQTRRTWLSVGGTSPALSERYLGRSVFWWLQKLGFMSVTADSTLGRRARSRELLIGRSVAECARYDGVSLLDRAVDATERTIIAESGRTLEVGAVIWATGYRQDFSWVDAPGFQHDGRVVQQRGVTNVPGLYTLGLPWQHTRGSSLIGWVGRDAEYLAQRIAGRRNLTGSLMAA